MFKAIWIALAIAFGLIVFPALPVQVGIEIVGPYDDAEWNEYHAEAYAEYADEFTALFNSYETKRAKNGALMIRSGNSGSYKFAKKG